MPENGTDFRMYANFPSHPKTLELVAQLGIMGRISLVNLWAYAALHRPLGYLDGMNETTIEYAAGWRGDGRQEGAFFDYLLAHKWLEEAKHHITEETCLYLHDWRKYQPYLASAYEAGLRNRLVRLGHEDTRPVYLFFHYWGVPGIEENVYHDSLALWRAKSPRQTDAEVLIDLLPKKLQPDCREWIKKYHYLWGLEGVKEVKICDDYTFRVVHNIDVELDVKNIIYEPGDHRIITENEAENKGNFKKRYRSCGMDGELILAPNMVAKSVDAKDFDLNPTETVESADTHNDCNETICIQFPTTTPEQINAANTDTPDSIPEGVAPSCAITACVAGTNENDNLSAPSQEGAVCSDPANGGQPTVIETVEIVPVPEPGTREEALIFLRNNFDVTCDKPAEEVCELYVGKDKNRWVEMAKNVLIQFNPKYAHFKGIELKKQIEETPRHPALNCPTVLDYVEQHEFFFGAVCHRYDFDQFPDRDPHFEATLNDLGLILKCDHDGDLETIQGWKRRNHYIRTQLIFDFISRNMKNRESLQMELESWRREILCQYEFSIETIPENAEQLDIETLASFIRKRPSDGKSLESTLWAMITPDEGASEIIIIPPRLKGVTGGAVRFVPADERFRLPHLEVVDPNQPKPEGAADIAKRYYARAAEPKALPEDDVRNTLAQFKNIISSNTPTNPNPGPNLKETVVPLSFHKAALMRKSQDEFYEEYAAKLKASGELPDYGDSSSPLKWGKHQAHSSQATISPAATAPEAAEPATPSTAQAATQPSSPGMIQGRATYNQQPNVPLQGIQGQLPMGYPQSQAYQQYVPRQAGRLQVMPYNQNYYTAFGMTICGVKDVTCETMVDIFKRFRSLTGYHNPNIHKEWKKFVKMAQEFADGGLDVEFSFNKAWEAFHHSPDFKDLRDPNSPNSLGSPMAWIRKWFNRGLTGNYEKSLMRREMWTDDHIKPLMERQAREAREASEENGFGNEGFQVEGRDFTLPDENVG